MAFEEGRALLVAALLALETECILSQPRLASLWLSVGFQRLVYGR